ncbi:MAG: hypothetical protein RPT25_15395 [Cycloclasticus sp.]
MKKFLVTLAIALISFDILARGPDPSEYGVTGGTSNFFGYLIVFALFYGAYKAHGIKGIIPPTLWFASFPVIAYTIDDVEVMFTLMLVAFTGIWWFDPVMKKLGLRDENYDKE